MSTGKKQFTAKEIASLKDEKKPKKIVKLSDDDKAKLQEYLEALDDILQREPEQLSPEVWDNVWPAIMATGTVPEAYKTRIGVTTVTVYDTIENGIYKRVPEGITQNGYIDIVWENWSREINKLNDKYYDIIVKALTYSLTNDVGRDKGMSTSELIKLILEECRREQDRSIFEKPFLPMYNNTMTNDFIAISKSILQPDLFGTTATYTTPDGNKILIERFGELQTGLSTSAKKIMSFAQVKLTQINYYRASRDHINNIVEIPLNEYAEKCGQQVEPRPMPTKEEQEKENRRAENTMRDFKKQLRKDLSGIAAYKESYTVTTGKYKGDFVDNQRLIYKYSISKGKIIIYFDQDAAKMLVNGGVIQYPTCLLLHDNRNPNAYNIGYKMAFHNSMDNNAAKGTESTLSVKKLLEACPEIPTYEKLQERGQRNWKDKIKKILESNLEEQIKIGLISQWEYRDPATGKVYKPQDAQQLTWVQYSRLMVDFIMVSPPDQTERRQKRAEAKAKAAIKAEKPKRKRGRPKKEVQPSLL